MACAISIEQSDNTLQVNDDRYDLARIVGVQVRVLGWKDRLKKGLLLGMVTSSALFYFTPSMEQAGNWLIVLFLPMVAFLFGGLMGLLSSTKYEFRIEFAHADETGVQWITAAKSRHATDYETFKEQAAELGKHIR
ncbi:hypothetical protein [Aeromonas sp. S16(2024)]|uniref:hypothetical protein n=1 Tax=Aeromonas sp. S16(2024) TaxID=3242889 RepID=UPI00352957D6